jgi:O-succinylbenzoic acid--CoA ligase
VRSYSGVMEVEPLPVPPGPEVLALLPRISTALEGGRPVLPYSASAPPPLVAARSPQRLPRDLAVAIGTSGSTGTPKRALLGAGALTASAEGTHERLAGPGRWMLALPAHHVAGLQVLVRSVVAGTEPVVMDLSRGFTTRAFGAATAELGSGRPLYTALVPTQLVRLLDDPASLDALRRYDAILVGGAALPPVLRARAARNRVTVVATYGMSESAGGCVYDGRPLPGAEIALDDQLRIHLGGATIAHGYLARPDLTREAFGTDEDGVRWFRTDDVGHLDEDVRLHVDGRVDDLVNTGGLKVAPRLVEEAVAQHVPGVREVVVVGTPDPEWGQVVSALVVLEPTGLVRSLTVGQVRARLRGIVPDHALPHRLLVAESVPLAGPGKPDRRAVTALFDVG